MPEGYPDTPRKGDAVILPESLPTSATLYLGAVDMKGEELVATGSRTVGVVATADTLAEAEQLCESVTVQIGGPFFHRTDIGTAEVLAKRVARMEALRAR